MKLKLVAVFTFICLCTFVVLTYAPIEKTMVVKVIAIACFIYTLMVGLPVLTEPDVLKNHKE